MTHGASIEVAHSARRTTLTSFGRIARMISTVVISIIANTLGKNGEIPEDNELR